MAQIYKPESKDVVDWLSERANRAHNSIDAIKRNQLAKVWITPTLINGWVHAGAPYEDFRYRLFAKDIIQVQGALDGGASGTVAFILLPPFWPTKTVPVYGHVKSGTSAIPCAIELSDTNGEATVYF